MSVFGDFMASEAVKKDQRISDLITERDALRGEMEELTFLNKELRRAGRLVQQESYEVKAHRDTLRRALEKMCIEMDAQLDPYEEISHTSVQDWLDEARQALADTATGGDDGD